MSSERSSRQVVLRGHHLLCVLGFRGLGYSEAFAYNMSQIVGRLHSSRDITVEVTENPDEICPPCPFLRDGGCHKKGVESEEKVTNQDRAVMKKLGLASGMKLPWSEILDRIPVSLTAEDLEEICQDCEWLPLGQCAEGLEKLRQQ